jgi:hypothetical protein
MNGTHRFHAFFRRHRRAVQQGLHYGRRGRHRLRAAAGGAAENQRSHSLRMIQRQFLRDHSSHRNPVDMRPFDTRRVQDSRRIVGHLRNRVWAGWQVAFPDPAVIEHNRLVMVRHRRPRSMPHVVRIPESHDEQQRVARS